MRVTLLSLILTITLSGTICLAQNTDESKPATKLEAFQSKTGIVLVRGFTHVGSIRGVGGNITISAREFFDASSSTTKITGISITIRESGRIERSNTSFIDADEIESLLHGLDYIAKSGKEVTKQQQFEVEYRTKGDFSITIFNDSGGDISVAVTSGRIGKASSFIELSDLAQLRQLILDAKAKL